MKKSSRYRRIQTALISAGWAFLICPLHAADEPEHSIRTMKAREAGWIARDNWLTRLPPDEQKTLCGAAARPALPSSCPTLTFPVDDPLPSKLDWRHRNGNWITPPKSQFYPQYCGSCWAYAAVAATESWWKIQHQNPDSIIDLSEQCLLSCSDAGSCSGGFSEFALEYIRSKGLVTESCFPYQGRDDVLCEEMCLTGSQDLVRIPGWGYVSLEEALPDLIKRAVYHHPVVTSLIIHQDFMYYAGGVYQYAWGDRVDFHYVLIVGWDDEQQCWICKNSFGTEWGETVDSKSYTPGSGDGGYFRIRYGNCEIGSYSHTIWNGVQAARGLTLRLDSLNVTVSAGDSTAQTLYIANRGATELEYAALDYGTRYLSHFHPDSFNAWQGRSWWCGDQKIEGYGNGWLQYLDLPALDLSQTSHPRLTFMTSWALESNPDGSVWLASWFDGFDAANVWISVDSGKHFTCGLPVTPDYNCRSASAFGDPMVWKMGRGIPGWTGDSEGWVPAEFDLAAYKHKAVVIRFSLASDLEFSTADDSRLIGFFVDNIKVTDGPTTLFENDGRMEEALVCSGFVGLEPAEWLAISPGSGKIPPGDSIALNLQITTLDREPGLYAGVVFFTANDTASLPFFYSAMMRLQLHIKAPMSTGLDDESSQDHAVADWRLQQNFPNPFNPATVISFHAPEPANIRLIVFDNLGRLVKILQEGPVAPGVQQIIWDGTDDRQQRTAAGVYFCRLEMNSGRHGTETKRTKVIKLLMVK